MSYVWPSPHKDQLVEAELSRFQECRNRWCFDRYGKYQVDMQTGQCHTFRRESGQLLIDEKPYRDIGEWVHAAILKRVE